MRINWKKKLDIKKNSINMGIFTFLEFSRTTPAHRNLQKALTHKVLTETPTQHEY